MRGWAVHAMSTLRSQEVVRWSAGLQRQEPLGFWPGMTLMGWELS